MAIPWPPPIQADPMPYFCPFCLSLCTMWAEILDPDAAKGWPRAIAPPQVLNFSGNHSIVYSFFHYLIWNGNRPKMEIRNSFETFEKSDLLVSIHPQITNLNNRSFTYIFFNGFKEFVINKKRGGPNKVFTADVW